MSLKTDWKDDVLDISMSGRRRYNIVRGNETVEQGVSLVDDTSYSQVGDTFGADELNEICEEVNGISSNLIANEINVPTSSWVSDSTNPNYGYKAIISSALYTNNFVPQYVDLIPYDGSVFFSDGEEDAKGLLNQIVNFSASGVTFYASAIPSVALKFRVGGQA